MPRNKYGRAFKKGVDEEAERKAKQLGGLAVAVGVALAVEGVKWAAPRVLDEAKSKGQRLISAAGKRKGFAMNRLRRRDKSPTEA